MDLGWFGLLQFLPAFLVTAAIVGIVTAFVTASRRRKRKAEAYARLLARDPSLTAAPAPCGLHAGQLHAFEGIPRGDRRHGVRYGVEGPLPVRVAGVDVGVRCAAFQWWYEQRVQTKNGSSYSERNHPVAVAELPVPLPASICLRPESLLGRAGVTRADQQVESTTVNRTFRITSTDERLTLQLLDANLQTVLPTEFGDRTIALQGRYVILSGRPRHHDATLEGVVGELQAVRQDLQRLLSQIPAQFWRAVGADPTGV